MTSTTVNATSLPLDRTAPGHTDRRWLRHVPLLVVVLAVLGCGAWGAWQPDRVGEPDTYAYRAQVHALAHGHVTLSASQYQSLTRELQADTADKVPQGMDVAQWVRNPAGRYTMEKNPGYPLLVLPLYLLGLMRVEPLLFAAIGAGATFLFVRRWRGPWTGMLAAVLLLASPLSLVMATRVFMPTFAGAMLVAGGVSLLGWRIVARDAPNRQRLAATVGALALLSIATVVRYTDLLVLLAAIAALGAVQWREARAAGRAAWRGVTHTVLVALVVCTPFAAAAGAYAQQAWGSWHTTGYALKTGGGPGGMGMPPGGAFRGPAGGPGGGPTSGHTSALGGDSVTFSRAAIPNNLRYMPGRLWAAVPTWLLSALLGLAALAMVVSRALRTGVDRSEDASRTRIAMLLLVAAWVLPWGLYAAYDWTAQQAGGGPGGWVHVARFYTPALVSIGIVGAVALESLLRSRRHWIAPAMGIATVAVAAGAIALPSDTMQGGPGGRGPMGGPGGGPMMDGPGPGAGPGPGPMGGPPPGMQGPG